jgi:hypothetical protein
LPTEATRPLEGHAVADRRMTEDRRAIPGHASLIDGDTVPWASERQETDPLSTTESEYVAPTHRGKEAVWLCSLLSQAFSPFKNLTMFLSDNQSAFAPMRDHPHTRTMHIDVRHHRLIYSSLRYVITYITIYRQSI